MNQEWVGLQVLGRELTPEERERSADIQKSLVLIREILEVFQTRTVPEPEPEPAPTPAPTPVPEPTPPSPVPTRALADGRYEGGNSEIYIELRIDEQVSGVISADIFRIGITGRSYVASIRTLPGKRVRREEGSWLIAGEDEQGNKTTGRLALNAADTNNPAVEGTIFLESTLHSLPVQNNFIFVAERVSGYMRTLGLEIETEETVDPLSSYEHNGVDMTMEKSLNQAGFELVRVGESSQIPQNPLGWGTAQLHALMQDFAEASLERRLWELHLLWLAKSSREGLLGVMFDSTQPLPRQGSAVFAETVRTHWDEDVNRKLIQTTAHELGHALNLAHRFERVVGRADSTSFMNYDWRYKGGDRVHEFWSNFDFSFDADELEFLRHAPLPKLIPGGAGFHSVNYWADGNGGYSPYLPEVPIPGYRLTLNPPDQGTVFEFAQPVLLEVIFENSGGKPFRLPREVLDPKAGFLEIVIKRLSGAFDGGTAQTRSFVPVVQRCYDLKTLSKITFARGVRIRNNINITFGSGGFSFAEPGEYEVTAIVSLYTKTSNLVVKSMPLRIRIATPKTMEEEREAQVLLREDVGLYFALGGSRALEKAGKDLEAVMKRRQGKEKNVRDPIVANIVRCQGIDKGRPYTRYKEDKWTSIDGDRSKAAEILGQLDKQALKIFDPHTAEFTEKLAKSHAKA
ncbi:MAG: acetyltransferase [Nitrospinaceae bacterium]|nr:acetyltransferase [Nitrospinaceae bacterium]NIR54882.1 acetyltransferase [Nitrospinaceae bacterium]NIS85311.1 acetyltransferase [Nitrospinaceae bacterium]NIT82120.1 acetyltransferase [Nitrospinaceae bacterium]NIU44381.1 acetyltransferase [Nitrospinaceae bacterium]